jgi:hypothetical protein
MKEMRMSKVMEMVSLERNVQIHLSNLYGARHALSAMTYLSIIAERLDLDDYLDILDNLVGRDIELDDDLLDLIHASPVALYEL